MAATEEVIPTAVTAGNEAAVEDKGGDKVAKKEKAAKPRKARSPPTHPPYFEMIKEAITTLKERNGSSQYAIQKFIEEKQKKLPSNFRKLLLVNLRKFVTSGRLVKVKASYKLPSARSEKKTVSTAKPKAKAKPTKRRSLAAAMAKAKPAPAKPAVKPKPKSKVAVAGTKRKAAKPAAVKPAKVAKTAGKATPSKKAAKPAVTKKAAPAAKKAPAVVKSVKPKSGKAAAGKRPMSTRGRK